MRTLMDLMDLRGRVALVTGGAGHIGSAMADALAELGARIAVLDLDPEACAGAARRLEGRWGGEAMAVPVDLEREEQVRSAPGQVL